MVFLIGAVFGFAVALFFGVRTLSYRTKVDNLTALKDILGFTKNTWV